MAAEDYINFDHWDEEDNSEPLVIKFIEIAYETEKAWLIRNKRGKFWVPKSISTIDDHTISIDGWFPITYLEERNE